jgi:hypothetical protein
MNILEAQFTTTKTGEARFVSHIKISVVYLLLHSDGSMVVPLFELSSWRTVFKDFRGSCM